MRDWKWQIQNRIKDLQTLQKEIELTPEEISIFKDADEFFDFAVTPYYLSLVDKNNPSCPIRRQIIPVVKVGTTGRRSSIDCVRSAQLRIGYPSQTQEHQ
jgi:lysine 2,3-aminomutase